jgi:hypothetical protein
MRGGNRDHWPDDSDPRPIEPAPGVLSIEAMRERARTQSRYF